MKIRKKIFLENFSVLCLILAFIMLIFYPVFRMPVIANSLLFILSVFLLILNNRIYRLNSIKLLFLIILFVQVLNIRSLNYIINNQYIIASMIVIIFVLFLDSNHKINYKMWYILLIPTSVSILYICAFKFMGIYYHFFESFLPGEVINYNNNLIYQGYSPIVFNEIGYIADVLVFSVFIFFARLLSREMNIKKNLSVFFLLVVFLYLLGRRSEFLALVLVLFIVFYLTLNKNKKFFLILSMLALLLVLISLILGFHDDFINYAGNDRFFVSIRDFLSNNDISNGRLALYNKALELLSVNPIFGIGWGSFSEYGSQIIGSVQNVHNIYLQLLVETGVVGFLLYLAAYLAILVYSINLLKIIDKMDEFDLFFSLSIQFYILIKGIFDNPIYYSNFWILYYLVLRPIFSLNDTKRYCNENR